jgi:hypothetical protein
VRSSGVKGYSGSTAKLGLVSSGYIGRWFGGDALSKRLHGLELPLMTISLRTITRIGRSCWFLRRLRNIRRKCLRLLHLGLRKFGNMGDSCGYS